jgi:hypothetical protein
VAGEYIKMERVDKRRLRGEKEDGVRLIVMRPLVDTLEPESDCQTNLERSVGWLWSELGQEI